MDKTELRYRNIFAPLQNKDSPPLSETEINFVFRGMWYPEDSAAWKNSFKIINAERAEE